MHTPAYYILTQHDDNVIQAELCILFHCSERPYLTEAGTEAVDHMMQINTLQVAELAYASAPPTTACHMIGLVHDTQNILIGLPVHYYSMDKVCAHIARPL